MQKNIPDDWVVVSGEVAWGAVTCPLWPEWLFWLEGRVEVRGHFLLGGWGFQCARLLGVQLPAKHLIFTESLTALWKCRWC